MHGSRIRLAVGLAVLAGCGAPGTEPRAEAPPDPAALPGSYRLVRVGADTVPAVSDAAGGCDVRTTGGLELTAETFELVLTRADYCRGQPTGYAQTTRTTGTYVLDGAALRLRVTAGPLYPGLAAAATRVAVYVEFFAAPRHEFRKAPAP